MRALLCLILVGLTISSTAAGQADAGAPDGGLYPDASSADVTEGCGEVTYFGVCTATGVTYCTDDTTGPISYDCPAEAPCGLMDCEVGGECLDITVQGDCEGNASCGWSDSNGYCYPRCYGYECLIPAGGECNVFFDLDGDGYLDFTPCENAAGYGCMDGTCATSTTCVAEDPPLCSGNMIQYCRYGTYSGFDCSFGGAEPYQCGPDSTGEATCLGQEGAQCSVSDGLECVVGLTCTGGICTGSSVYDAAMGQDLARPVDAAGRDLATGQDRFTSPDSGSTCNCAVGETCTASGECVPAGQHDAGVRSSPPLTHDVACFGCAQARPTALGLGAWLLLLLWRRRPAA